MDHFGSMKRSRAGMMASVRSGVRAALRELPESDRTRQLLGQSMSGVDPDSLLDVFEIELERDAAFRGQRIAGQPMGPLPRVNLPWLGPQTPVVQSPSVAGRRPDSQGAFGLDVPPGGRIPMPAESRREWAGRIEGGRTPGTDLRWDAQAAARMQSGIISGGGMQQQVDPDAPWLTLRMKPNTGALGTQARIRVTAGLQQGGAETTRTFMIGGGFIASFLLAGYDVVRVEVLERLQADVQDVQFTWSREGLQAGAQNLVLPERIRAGTGQVPEGAYAIIPNTADPMWAWSNPTIVGFSADTGILSNTPNVVLGSTYSADLAANNVVWLLRPI